jgi:nitrile hydratase
MAATAQGRIKMADTGMGPHDVGGAEAGSIDTADHGMTHWEKHANAMRMVTTGKGTMGTLDEMRRAVEDLGERYYDIGYFERQTEASIKIMVEHGIFTQDQLDERMVEIEQRFAVPIVPLPADHGHDHEHGPIKEDDTGGPPNRHHVMNLAQQEILQELGLITADEVRAMIENFDADFPSRGPQVVAKAWCEPDFKARLLKDARPVIEEMDLDLGFQTRIIALENTAKVHNVVVCTLCSCYPRFLLGQPPTWYKSRAYRSRVVHEPRAVLAEFGTTLPDDTVIRVHDSNADMRYLVVPMQPEGTEDWPHEKLEKLITRDMLVGVTLPEVP